MSDKLKLTTRQEKILALFEWKKSYSSGWLRERLEPKISVATLKRDLSVLCRFGYLRRSGGNRDSAYSLLGRGLIHRPFELGSYYQTPENDRRAMADFNIDIFEILRKEELFSSDELSKLDNATKVFKRAAINANQTIHKKELERFVIEFAWKSSQIEGNTYTLLETERLIREGLKKDDRSDFETAMILNHEKAYEFLLEQTQDGEFELSRRMLEKIHSIVIDELGVGTGLRKSAVGISGSVYKPPALIYLIEEQLGKLIEAINASPNVYQKALVAVLGESYLQPFDDGNKRTARVLANGILLQSGHAPLSYRSVSDQDYKEACLIFYEQNSVEPFKKLFIEQYIFAADNYNIANV